MSEVEEARELNEPFFSENRSQRSLVLRLFMLGLLCPGAPYHLRGRSGLGAFVNIVLASFWLMYMLIWSVVKFSPLVPFAIVGTVWLLTVAMVAFDASRLRAVEREQLNQASPAMSSLIAFILTSWAGPLLAIFLLTNTVFWTLHRVQEDSMYPTLLSGDLVLIDRRAYDLQGPSPGDVIAYHDDGRLQFGRIIAGPGESVSRLDGTWFVDGTRQNQAAVINDATTHFTERAGATPAEVDARWETNGQRAYIVAGQPAGGASQMQDPDEWIVGEKQLFVLHDNRSSDADSRTKEGVDFDDVRGMVLYIVDSRVNVGTVSRERAGRQVQQPNLLIRRSASR